MQLRTPDGRSLSQEVIDKIVERVREVVEPEKIILFGSAGRGDMGKHSDIDLLVIAEPRHGEEISETEVAVYLNLGKGREGKRIWMPFDFRLVTPETIEKYGNYIDMVYKPALEEGKVIYERR